MTARERAHDLIPVAVARRLLLAGCALDRAPARATKPRVIALIRELGFVQVDSINSVERGLQSLFSVHHASTGPMALSRPHCATRAR